MAGIFLNCGGGKKAAGNLLKTNVVVVLSDSLHETARCDTIALGRLVQGEVVTGEFMLRNAGAGPVVVVSVESSCGCTTVDYPKQPVIPGKMVPFTFRLDTEGFIGQQHKQITIRTAPNYRTCRVVLSADVVQE